MGFFRKFFSKTTNVVTTGIIAAVPVIAISAILISGTLAAGNDVTKTFNPINNTYLQISVHGTRNDVRGTKVAISSNLSVITTDVTVNPPVLTGEAPGIAAVSYLTSIGAGRNITYQVYDPNGIAGFRIPGGKMEVSKAGGDPQLINLKLRIDAQNNGSVTEKDFTDWNNEHSDNKIAWESLHPEIADVNPSTGYFTAVDNGAAIIIGTVTDKWGTKQSIPVLVNVGTAAYVIHSNDGTYWLPGDVPNTYFETDENGKIKVPPHIIYNPDGPGNGSGDLDIYRGDDGKYYVADDSYPNIWHEFDTVEGKIRVNGRTIWGGDDFKPGGGDDKDAMFNDATDFYYAYLGQNVYQKVDRNGSYAGLISNNLPFGAGGDGKPGTADDLNNVIYANDGKFYSGPYMDGETEYYIGDKPLNAGGNGQLNTSGDSFGGHASPIADTDTKWYRDSDGNFTTTPPIVIYVSRVEITPRNASVRKGDTLQMNANLYISTSSQSGETLTEGESGGVFWSVIPPDSGVSISEGGLLSVGANTTLSSVTVKAVYKLNNSITDTVTVKIFKDITDVPDDSEGRVLTPEQTGDSSNWVEIATNGAYSLIVRANYINIYPSGHNGDPTWQYTSYGPADAYNTSTVRSKINDWFRGAASGTADNLSGNARLRSFTMQNNAVNVPGTASTNAGLTNGFSKPTTVKIPSGSDDVAFALSYSEAARFCSNTHDVRGANPQIQQSSDRAKTNYSKITIPQIYAYGAWLRSPGDVSGTMGAINYDGRAFQYHSSTSVSSERGLVYPALWVESAIFNN